MRFCKYCREWKPNSDFYGFINFDESQRRICQSCRGKIARKATAPRFGSTKVEVPK